MEEVIALRLFELFDTSGDLQLNAKEFTCGLSLNTPLSSAETVW